MVNSILDIEAIKGRAGTVSDLEAQARADMQRAGIPYWPFGDAIKASLADVPVLLAEVEALRAEFEKRSHEPDPLRAALIGILRADGYVICEPACGEGSTVAGVPVVEFHDPRTGAFNHDAAASDMLGEDAADDYAEDSPRCGTFTGVDPGPRICPSCEKPLPPDGKCRSPYVDCQRVSAPEAKPLLLEPGTSVRITGDMRWRGRYGIVETHEPGKLPDVCVIELGSTLADAVDIGEDYVVNPDVGEPTKAETPSAKPRQRAPEPPKLVTEWAPDGRDFDGYVKELPFSATEVEAMLPDFRAFIQSANPEQRKARWGGVFKDWLKARLANQA